MIVLNTPLQKFDAMDFDDLSASMELPVDLDDDAGAGVGVGVVVVECFHARIVAHEIRVYFAL